MRVLVLTQVMVYPADSGAKMKTWQVLQYLARRHTVFYCTFTRHHTEQLDRLPVPVQRSSIVELKRSFYKDGYYFIKSLLCNDSVLLLRDEEQAMRRSVSQLLEEEAIEVVYVDQLNMMRFVPRSWPGKVVLDEHNAVWLVIERLRREARNPFIRWLLWREVGQIRRIEGEACRRAQRVLAVSEQDREALQEVGGPEVKISVVPITVDCAHFAAVRRARKPISGRLFTIGTLFWPPNSEGIAWWLCSGYGYLQSIYPGITYDIVGARPSRELRRQAKKHATVCLHGYVTDARSFWSQAAIMVVPLLTGGGVRVKILEAMAIGVPIISTSVGCEGLAVEDGKHLMIADTPTAFARACKAVLQDRHLACTLVTNAYQLVKERYDAAEALNILHTIIEEEPSQKI